METQQSARAAHLRALARQVIIDASMEHASSCSTMEAHVRPDNGSSTIAANPSKIGVRIMQTVRTDAVSMESVLPTNVTMATSAHARMAAGAINSAMVAFGARVRRLSPRSAAMGETMIVTIAGGQYPELNLDPRSAMYTITSSIVNVSLGDTPHGTTAYNALFALGITLFIMTFILNIGSDYVARKYRKEYE